MTRSRFNPRNLPLLAIFLILALWPIWHGGTGMTLRVMGMAFLYAALAYSWNLHALTGAISLGHAAFFGLGAYGAALATHHWHIVPYASIMIGAGLGGAYGLLWILAFKKLRGARFALATLASVEIPKVIIDNWDSFTYGSLGLAGLPGFPPFRLGALFVAMNESLTAQYYFLFLFMTLVFWIHHGGITSRWGWAIRALREDEVAAAALGINVIRTHMGVLVLSAFLTGLCGGIYAHLIGLIEPPLVFNLHISALPLVLSIFGGRYQAFGPLLGALILYPLDQLLFHSWLPAGHAALYGMVIIITILFFPQGVGTWLQQRLGPASS